VLLLSTGSSCDILGRDRLHTKARTRLRRRRWVNTYLIFNSGGGNLSESAPCSGAASTQLRPEPELAPRGGAECQACSALHFYFSRDTQFSPAGKCVYPTYISPKSKRVCININIDLSFNYIPPPPDLFKGPNTLTRPRRVDNVERRAYGGGPNPGSVGLAVAFNFKNVMLCTLLKFIYLFNNDDDDAERGSEAKRQAKVGRGKVCPLAIDSM
jgi:hypothetical protein